MSASSHYNYDIEALLEQHYPIKIKPQGYSMYPLFLPGRDEAIIEKVPVSALRRGDVALYRRDQGILVLHRICRITSEGFYFVGDNQVEIEGPLRPDQIRGKMTSMIRNGYSISVRNPLYRFLCMTWLLLRPFRHKISLFASRCKKVWQNHLH